jgi:predicted nuclease of restriction endonuclease-like (RecB) superfamily
MNVRAGGLERGRCAVAGFARIQHSNATIFEQGRQSAMSKSNTSLPAGFSTLLKDVKARIQKAQTRAILSANAELVRLYWDIGRLIEARQSKQGWGASVIPRLAIELRNELPEIKGFSERNIDSMLAFYREYTDPSSISQQPVAKIAQRPFLPQAAAKTALSTKVQQPVALLPKSLLWLIPWGHHLLLLARLKDLPARIWYMHQTLANGWSRNVLVHMIESGAHLRQGKALSNFERLLPPPQSDLVQQALKDPYIFDFLTLAEPFHERELETSLLRHLERFLLELGQGFAFVGRQVRVEVGGDDFSIDLLFYHLRLRSFVVIDLKQGAFKPEFAGKMNFYLNAIDEQQRQASDGPSIGLILCQKRNHVVAEYALRGIEKPIGISQYELTRALPSRLKSALPTVEEIEAELAESSRAAAAKPRAKKKKRREIRKKRSSRKTSEKRRRRYNASSNRLQCRTKPRNNTQQRVAPTRCDRCAFNYRRGCEGVGQSR